MLLLFQNKDAEFEELEKRFSYLTHSVAVFCQNIQRLKEHLHETTVSQFNIAENVADLYKEKQLQIREVERFRMAHRHVISTFWNQFVRYDSNSQFEKFKYVQ